MTKNPLFSTYRQGENRATSSMLAVFQRIDLALLETILASAAGESSLAMVTFTNQPPGTGHSVPDARISARFSYWFEGRSQAVIATASANFSEGDRQPRVCRGRPLSSAATASSSSWVTAARSVPFGKYWRSRPLVFSFVPRCHGLRGSQM
jgi:hypothetical protein